MRTVCYATLTIPLLVLIVGLSSATIYWFDCFAQTSPNLHHYHAVASDIARTCFFALITAFILKLITTVKDIIVLTGTKSPAVYQRKISPFDGFYYPILEELVKFLLVVYTAHSHHQEGPRLIWSLVQVAAVTFVFNMNLTVLNLIKFSPFTYSERYSKFLELFGIWYDHEEKLMSSNKDAVFMLADSILKSATPSAAPSPQKNRNSVESGDSSKTLVGAFPPKFNINSFSESDPKGLSKIQSMPILPDSSSSHSQSSNRTMTKSQFKSCYDLVDKLYSVSPKNTYHFDRATASVISANVDEEDDDDIESQYDVTSYDPPADFHSNQHKRWDFGGGGGGGFDVTFPGGTKVTLGGGGGAGVDYSEGESDDDSDGEDKPETQAVQKYNVNDFVNWFTWLLPIYLPLKSDSPERRPLLQSPKKPKVDHGIRQKLSQYTLNKRSSYDSCSLKYHDLENQINEAVSVTFDFNLFKQFVLTYFDYDLHTYNSPFEVDPVFQNYNILMKDFASGYSILLNATTAWWHCVTFLVYSGPFLLVSPNIFHFCIGFVGLNVVKLFNTNFVNFQLADKPFQHRIIGESVINSVLFIVVLYYYYLLSV